MCVYVLPLGIRATAAEFQAPSDAHLPAEQVWEVVRHPPPPGPGLPRTPPPDSSHALAGETEHLSSQLDSFLGSLEGGITFPS